MRLHARSCSSARVQVTRVRINVGSGSDDDDDTNYTRLQRARRICLLDVFDWASETFGECAADIAFSECAACVL